MMHLKKIFLCILAVGLVIFSGCADTENTLSDTDRDSRQDSGINTPDTPAEGKEVTSGRKGYDAWESDWFLLDSFDIDTASNAGDDEYTKIQCRLYLPEGKPPYPCLLVPHGWPGNAEGMIDAAEMLRDRGYACLIWSARGYGTSTELARGDTYDHEVKDTIRLINWLAEQDFVIPEDNPDVVFANGKLVDFDFNNDGVQEEDDIPGDESKDFRLGFFGGSYGGAIQLLTASYDRRVDVIAPMITWNDLFQSFAPNDNLKILYCLFFLVGGITEANTAIDPAITEWYTTGLVTTEPSRHMIQGGMKRSPAGRIDKIKIPTFVIQGQLDNVFDLNQGVANFEAIRNNGNEAKMYWFRGGHTGLMENIQLAALRGVTWLDHYLKDNSIDTGPEFEYDIPDASGRWTIKSGTWPLVSREEETAYYLHGDGETGRLVSAASGEGLDYEGDIIFDSVINKPFLATSINDILVTDAGEAQAINYDSPLTSVSYDTDPFGKDTEITGVPRINIWLSSSCTDISFFFKVYDVAPDGKAGLIDINLTPIRLPERESADNLNRNLDDWIYGNPVFQELNENFFEYIVKGMDLETLLAGIPQVGLPRWGNLELPKLYTYDLRGFTHYFKKGHRLRLVIATSNFGYTHSRVPGKGYIWHGNEYVSKLMLPVVGE